MGVQSSSLHFAGLVMAESASKEGYWSFYMPITAAESF